MAKYTMEVSVGVFRIPVFSKDGKISGYQSKAMVSATSFVSSSGAGRAIGNAQASLVAYGITLDTKALSVGREVLIRGGGQYSYVGDATFDLPDIAVLQVQIVGGWHIEYDRSNRFVPTYDPLLMYPIQINGLINLRR
jgi:hypothetical protein